MLHTAAKQHVGMEIWPLLHYEPTSTRHWPAPDAGQAALHVRQGQRWVGVWLELQGSAVRHHHHLQRDTPEGSAALGSLSRIRQSCQRWRAGEWAVHNPAHVSGVPGATVAGALPAQPFAASNPVVVSGRLASRASPSCQHL